MALWTFATTDKLTDALCDDFHKYLSSLKPHRKRIYLAFSGGNTPGAFFNKLASRQQSPDQRMDWRNIHLFWVDERCVPPGHPESNYGMTRARLLPAIDIDMSQVHRIRGENEPVAEALRYGEEILDSFKQDGGIPVFDWIFLGIGEDGHTASIFPDRPDLLRSESICEAARHPLTGQERLTMTGTVLLKAGRLSFLVTGHAKSTVVRQIIKREAEAERYPACYIDKFRTNTEWYLDTSAAEQLNP